MSPLAKDWKTIVRELVADRGWTQDRAVRKAADWADENLENSRGLGYSNLSKRLSPGDNPKYGVDPHVFEAFAGAFGVDPASTFIEYRLRTMDFAEAAAALAAYEAITRSGAQGEEGEGPPSAAMTG